MAESALVCLPSENTDRNGDDRCSGQTQIVEQARLVGAGPGAGAGRSRWVLEQGLPPLQEEESLWLGQVDPEGGAGQHGGESPQCSKHRYSGDPNEQQ